jgi:hypothetical protein
MSNTENRKKLEQEIQLHREKIKELRQQLEVQGVENWQWLVGKCFRMSAISYGKALQIHRVDEREVTLDTLSVYYPYNGAGSLSITDSPYFSIGKKDIEGHLVPPEEFNAKFEEVVELLREKYITNDLNN